MSKAASFERSSPVRSRSSCRLRAKWLRLIGLAQLGIDLAVVCEQSGFVFEI